MKAQLIGVIYSEVSEGIGTEDNPGRMVEYWHTKTGELIKRRDVWQDARREAELSARWRELEERRKAQS